MAVQFVHQYLKEKQKASENAFRTLVPAARVSWDRQAKRIEIENYDALPVDLLSVTAKTP